VVKNDFKLALIGFTQSQCLNKDMTVATGTPEYQAPEIRLFSDPKHASRLNYKANLADMWSLGVSLFVLLRKGLRLPFAVMSNQDVYYRLLV
jgi:serine/threonine protein kinase